VCGFLDLREFLTYNIGPDHGYCAKYGSGAKVCPLQYLLCSCRVLDVHAGRHIDFLRHLDCYGLDCAPQRSQIITLYLSHEYEHSTLKPGRRLSPAHSKSNSFIASHFESMRCTHRMGNKHKLFTASSRTLTPHSFSLYPCVSNKERQFVSQASIRAIYIRQLRLNSVFTLGFDYFDGLPCKYKDNRQIHLDKKRQQQHSTRKVLGHHAQTNKKQCTHFSVHHGLTS
jgi:hypothetical protein